MIPVQAIVSLRADTHYTLVAWNDDDGAAAEAVIRLSLKDRPERLPVSRSHLHLFKEM